MLPSYYLVAFSLIIIMMVVMQSIQLEKVLSLRLTLSVVYLIVAVIFLWLQLNAPQSPFEGDVLFIYQLFNGYIILMFIVELVLTFRHANLKSNHYALFVKAMKNSKFNIYYIVDHKERVKDMSLGMLQELSLEKEDVIGKKLNAVLQKTIRLSHINQEEGNLKTLDTFFQRYKKEALPQQMDKQELTFFNSVGEIVHLHVILQPVFVFGKYRGRIAVGEKKTDFDLMVVEKELEQSNQELESIRHKFIATLELSEEGLFHIDQEDRYIWMSPALADQLMLKTDQLSIESFEQLIHPEDVKKRQDALKMIQLDHPTYDIKYRIRANQYYIWVQEKGKYLFEDARKKTIMGVMKHIPTKHFMASNMPVLDELKTYHEIHLFLKKRKDEQKFFDVLLVHVHNLNDINERYGREVGNMFLSEYVKQLKQTFITESGDIFRMTGSRFSVIITDPRKVDLLTQGLKTQGPFLNVQLQYGSIQAELKVHAVMMQDDAFKDIDGGLYKMLEALKTLETPMRKQPVMRLYD
jgi:GGDEF domain-containing protein/PAS domain-containing protein